MKTKLIVVLLFALLITLGMIWGVAAQEPGQPSHRSHPHVDHISGRSSGNPPPSGNGIHTQNIASAMVGQPGVSFRYVQTFGETAVPYYNSTTHLNQPTTLAVDEADNIYIGEIDGHRVLKFNSAGTFQTQIGYTGLCWVWEEADSGTCEPYGLAIAPDGQVWIAEGSSRVSVFTYTTTAFTYTQQLGETRGPGDDNDHFDEPDGVAFDSAGRIYVADWGNHRIQIFDSSGTYSATLGTGICGWGNDEFCYPRGLAIGSGDVLYVADTDNGRVQVYQLVGDTMVFSQTIDSTGIDYFSWVNGVAVDDTNLYVADEGYSQVYVFDRTGAYQSTIDGDCGGNDDFCWPDDVAVDSSGNIYVSDWDGMRVMKCSGGPAWTCSLFAGTTGIPYISDTAHYNHPEGIAVDGNGNIYVTDRHRVTKLNSAGTAQWSIGEPGIYGWDNIHFDSPTHVAIDGNGRIYVADEWNYRVQIFNSNGTYYDTLGTGLCEWDNTGLCLPTGVDIGNDGRIYVADRANSRVQVFNSNLTYFTTIGDEYCDDSDGIGSTEFCWARGVAVDANNNIFVADTNNNRVQKCTLTNTCITFAGVTGEWGEEFDHLNEPHDVAVDAQGRVYVADGWNNRVQVFDSSGTFLTTIAGEWDSGTSEIRGASSVDVDSQGNVYVADVDNHRIQKFASGVPGWTQVNINGFGKRWNSGISSLEAFNGQLYASAANWDDGMQIWRASSPWTAASQPGFGSTYTSTNRAVGDMIEFNGQLYAGTGWGDNPGQIWRSTDGTIWSQVEDDAFGNANNNMVAPFGIFNGQLYVGVENDTNGLEIWRSDTGDNGDWESVVTGGNANTNNTIVTGFTEYNSSFYAAVENGTDGCEIWQTPDGTTWNRIRTGGFGDTDNTYTSGPAVFGGNLYVGTGNSTTGAQIWRFNGTTWSQATGNGFGDINNRKVESLIVYDNNLYAVTNNEVTGAEVWYSTAGNSWQQANIDGWGDNNNEFTLWSSGSVVLSDTLYIGIWNWSNGGKIWALDNSQQVYLPIVLKNQ